MLLFIERAVDQSVLAVYAAQRRQTKASASHQSNMKYGKFC
jgi:hypothetical protein